MCKVVNLLQSDLITLFVDCMLLNVRIYLQAELCMYHLKTVL